MNQDQGSENKYLNASTRQLIWWQYKKHALAMVGLWLISGLYITAIFCEFLAPYNKDMRHFDVIYGPPSKIRIFDEKGAIHWPFVYGLNMEIDTETQQLSYEEITDERYPIRFFVRGDAYEFWGLWRSDLHLFGVESPGKLFLFGTDRMGRDMFSRCFYREQDISFHRDVGGFLKSASRGHAGRHFRISWGMGRRSDPKGHRDNKMFSEYTSLDGAFRGDASSLAGTESVFRHYHHSVAYWLD